MLRHLNEASSRLILDRYPRGALAEYIIVFWSDDQSQFVDFEFQEMPPFFSSAIPIAWSSSA